MPRSHSHSRQRTGNHSRHSDDNSSNSNKSSCGSLYTWLLSLLAVFLLGTVIVLSVVKSFFGVDWNDAIDIHEVSYYDSLNTLPCGSTLPSINNNSSTIIVEKVPRIIHQTWKTSAIPSKWATQSAQCQAMHKDFEYKLWTDESSIEFIKEHYNWFLPTYIGYRFNIQRADAIRYFVLHKYGGVYLDLDVGCRKPFHPLLNFQTILPVTKPIGVSNDVMFSEPNSKFMDSVIHNLLAFDHYVISDYPTVMFSTGPMFLSAVLSLWNSKPSYADVSAVSVNNAGNASSTLSDIISRSSLAPEHHNEGHTVRILPKELYGKNAEPDQVPDSFFHHYYGSSWHQNDSAIFTFLGQFGKQLMNVAFVVVILGTVFIVVKRVRRRRSKNACVINGAAYGLLQSSQSTPNTLGYDSDIEDGNGRVTPPLLPSSSRSAPSSSRRRRKQHRRAITSGARNWLFGKRNIGLSLDAAGDPAAGAGRRRSASTGAGAISLPLHSSESEDAQFYTSSSEDGRESRRDSIFGTGEDRANVRRASIWMGQDAEDEDGDQTVVSSSIRAPLLHRRASSQPDVEGASTSGKSTADGRTPKPPNYLELPPPPPYRPPSPRSPTLASLPVPLSPGQRTWLSSFFSSVANTRTPSPSSSSSQLPFFSNNNSNNHSRSNSNTSQFQTHSVANQSSSNLHARTTSVPSSRSCSPENSNSTSAQHSRQQSSNLNINGAEIFNSHLDERTPGRRSESIDDDAFSLHSVKARR